MSLLDVSKIPIVFFGLFTVVSFPKGSLSCIPSRPTIVFSDTPITLLKGRVTDICCVSSLFLSFRPQKLLMSQGCHV